jgi:hypothetical protein
MINLQKLSLATLSAAILASLGGNAPAAAAQLFFNISGNFIYQKFLSEPTPIYDELDGGSFTGFFSIDSEEGDTDPAVGQGTYELSSWQIDLLTSSGDLVGQLTSADGGGSGEILVDVTTTSTSSARLVRTYLIEFQDVLTGGTGAGNEANLPFAKGGFSCSFFGECQQLLTFEEFVELLNSPDNALPDVLPQEIVGRVGPAVTSREFYTVRFTENGVPIPVGGPFLGVGQVTAVSPPTAVAEPSTTVGLCLLGLGFLLKKKVAFSPKTKATVKA